MIRVLFVCLGNICRSPLAESIFNRMLKDHQLNDKIDCDSAGTSNYHIGELPDYRTLQVAGAHGLTSEHQARQFASEDFRAFDYIIAMDVENKADIDQLVSGVLYNDCKVFLMREFDSEEKEVNVPDPYFGGEDGFENIYTILDRTCAELLQFLRNAHKI